MRYLKVTVQDRTGNGRADSVLLQFCEQVGKPGEDQVIDKAFALDFDADGRVDYKMGDVTGNGRENNVDQRLLESFANACLKLHWFNRGATWTRFIKLFAEDFHRDGTPNVVRLQWHEGQGLASDCMRGAWSVAFDADNDGRLDGSVQGDVNRDGQVDRVDQALVLQLARAFLKFNWR
ncbi:hypothetical protein KVG96_26105 [Pseudomonas sp. COR58]|uniref:Dockerin domain-containing protein n=1 Tax=Pseudomonas ekonensis TaxID=2842353 RepID=A0ABS6PLW3_9PSED|nr:hypothetical protein [Pseudomonas ekonensis]MBV4461448.1 hypothetical protein [Pseudomonas ekonensis]